MSQTNQIYELPLPRSLPKQVASTAAQEADLFCYGSLPTSLPRQVARWAVWAAVNISGLTFGY